MIRFTCRCSLAALAWLCAALPSFAQDLGDPLAPALLYYPLQCHDAGNCRIDCFQAGRSVVSRINLTPQDTVLLVVNSGFSDALIPRWIEVRSADARASQTILLGRETVCDFQSLTINPIARP